MIDEVRVASEPEAPLTRRLLAEFVGTLLLVAVGAGAATALLIGATERFKTLPEIPQGGDPRQNEFFGALLDTTFGDIVPVALAFAFVLAVIVYAFGGVSGGHFNPAVTFALALAGRFKWVSVFPYWVAQVLGGIAGGFVVAGIYARNGEIGGEDVLMGATVIAEGVNWPKALLAEAVIGFILMTAIMAIAVDPRAPKGWSGLVIGLALGAGILVTADATGGSANFARSLGPLVAVLAFDPGSIPWNDLLIYAGGPVIGASAAALVYESITGLERVAPPPRPGAATPAGPGGAGPAAGSPAPIGTSGPPRPGVEGQAPEHSTAPTPPPPPTE